MYDQRSLLAAFLVQILFITACGTSEQNESGREGTAIEITSPVGHYRYGSIDMWIREDSLFILRQDQSGDGVATGQAGRWKKHGEQLTLGEQEHADYRIVADGIRRVAGDGPYPASLDRIDQNKDGRIPLMRLAGAYRSIANNHSFMPCGSDTEFPLAVGDHVQELSNRADQAAAAGSQPLFMEIDARFGPGPAMEGDGEEEYLWLERVGTILPEQRCP